MNVSLSPAEPRRIAVGRAEDPFKKYWLAILAGFALTGAWLCLPMMETSIGSTRVRTEPPLADLSVEQDLDSAVNPSGAPGLAVEREAGGAYRLRKDDAPAGPRLYQPPEEPKSAAAAGAAPASGSLAQSLKAVGEGSGGSSWGAEKPQRGFVSPRLSGVSLGGLGGASGGSSASAGSSGTGVFGTRLPQVGASSARGLREDGGDAQAPAGGLSALRRSAQALGQAAVQRSADAANAGVSRVFDGAKSQNSIGAGAAAASGAGLYAELDAAPVNLKVNPVELSKKDIKPPPATAPPAGTAPVGMSGQQWGMMFFSLLVGGLITGPGGQMAASMMMQMTMMQGKQQ